MASTVDSQKRKTVASSAARAPRGHPPHLRIVKNDELSGERSDKERSKQSAKLFGLSEAMLLQLLALSLVALGLVMILSASSVVSILDYGSPWSLLLRQGLWSIFGLVAFIAAKRVSFVRLRAFATPALLICIVLLFVVLLPGIGQISGGSSRWVGAGPIKIQPSEFAKLAFALFAADLVARRESARNFFTSVLRPLGLILVLVSILILKQPDLGTAIVLVVITISVLFAAGMPHRQLALLTGAIGLAGTGIALVDPYQRQRLFSFLNPFAHASTTGYQVVQSLVSLGSGHIGGAGLGASIAKWILPNAQTDFIFAVIGNELGFIGATLTVLAFVFFAILGFRIAARTTDRFSSLLAAGLTCWIVFQAFINIGGVIGVMPETGIPLPFVSFGGSSLVVVLAATGLLVNIASASNTSRSSRRAPREGRQLIQMRRAGK